MVVHQLAAPKTFQKLWRTQYEAAKKNDFEIIRQCIWKMYLSKEDRGAWKQVYKVCYPATAGLLYSKYNVKEEFALKDLFQEAVMVLHKYLTTPGYSVRKKVEDFIKGVAVKMRLNEIKKMKRQHEIDRYLLEEQIVSERKMPIIELFDVNEFCRNLFLKHFEKQTIPDQIILVARKIDGRPYNEIADLLDLPDDKPTNRLGAARQRVFQAMKRWRTDIENEDVLKICKQSL